MQNTKQNLKDLIYVLTDKEKWKDWKHYPDWFNKAANDGGIRAAWIMILQACLEEIEMHQDLNGRLYKQLYPSG